MIHFSCNTPSSIYAKANVLNREGIFQKHEDDK